MKKNVYFVLIAAVLFIAAGCGKTEKIDYDASKLIGHWRNEHIGDIIFREDGMYSNNIENDYWWPYTVERMFIYVDKDFYIDEYSFRFEDDDTLIMEHCRGGLQNEYTRVKDE